MKKGVNSMAQYVIIGNGVAAIGCIEGIRKEDTQNKIIVNSEEPHPVYCRPLISYYLEGKTDLEKMAYRNPNFYDEMNCEVLYGRKAVRIDNTTKQITLNDETIIPYDKLCIATGSSPFIPPFAGLETVEQKYSFMTLDNMLELESAIDKDSKVLIIGAGLIGLKCAEGLKDRVCSITVCDLAERVLSSILDSDCAAMMQKHLEANGIQFMLGDSAVSFDQNTALMKSGKTVNFDILVLAILPNAYMQGNCAGINMSGGTAIFDKAIPMNSIGFFGLHVMTADSYYTTDEGGELYEEKTENTLKRLFTRDGYLTGFILIGNTDTSRAGIYTSLIREHTPLNSIDFETLKRGEISTAFSYEKRKHIFGGVV